MSASAVLFGLAALCLLGVILIAWSNWPPEEWRLRDGEGNDADKLYEQFQKDWPSFVGKPEGSSTGPVFAAYQRRDSIRRKQK